MQYGWGRGHRVCICACALMVAWLCVRWEALRLRLRLSELVCNHSKSVRMFLLQGLGSLWPTTHTMMSGTVCGDWRGVYMHRVVSRRRRRDAATRQSTGHEAHTATSRNRARRSLRFIFRVREHDHV